MTSKEFFFFSYWSRQTFGQTLKWILVAGTKVTSSRGGLISNPDMQHNHHTRAFDRTSKSAGTGLGKEIIQSLPRPTFPILLQEFYDHQFVRETKGNEDALQFKRKARPHKETRKNVIGVRDNRLTEKLDSRGSRTILRHAVVTSYRVLRTGQISGIITSAVRARFSGSGPEGQKFLGGVTV